MAAWQERLAQEALAIGVEVLEVVPLHGGACQENFRLRCTGADLVLRSDANQSLPGSLDRRMEAEVIALAASWGVPTPEPRLVLADLLRAGSTAYVMDFVEGVAIGAKVVRDPRLERARGVLPAQLAAALATIHRIRPDDAPELRPTCPQDGLASDAVTAALRFCRTMMDTLEPRPTMERIYGWLGAHRPDPGPLVLVHGDYRVGNFLVGDEGLNAVLDWEFAHWGSAGEDLAWITVRDWRFGRLDKPVGGLCGRSEFGRAYRNAGGVALDPATLRWFEVLGNLRWATGAMFQARRVLSGAEADLELLAIGRRAAEMEWEAMRRMEVL